jgi:hypothetical protein
MVDKLTRRSDTSSFDHRWLVRSVVFFTGLFDSSTLVFRVDKQGAETLLANLSPRERHELNAQLGTAVDSILSDAMDRVAERSQEAQRQLQEAQANEAHRRLGEVATSSAIRRG